MRGVGGVKREIGNAEESVEGAWIARLKIVKRENDKDWQRRNILLYVDNRAERKMNSRWNGSEGAKTRT